MEQGRVCPVRGFVAIAALASVARAALAVARARCGILRLAVLCCAPSHRTVTVAAISNLSSAIQSHAVSAFLHRYLGCFRSTPRRRRRRRNFGERIPTLQFCRRHPPSIMRTAGNHHAARRIEAFERIAFALRGDGAIALAWLQPAGAPII